MSTPTSAPTATAVAETYTPLLSDAYTDDQLAKLHQLSHGYYNRIALHEGISIALSVGYATFLAVYVKHDFFTYYAVAVCVLQVVSVVQMLVGHHMWTLEEFFFYKKTRARDICAALSPTLRGKLYVISWRSTKFLLLFAVLAAYFGPLLLYVDWTSPPTGLSSCSSAVNSAATENAFNPRGFFNNERPYTSTFIGKFCTMFQRYAEPNLQKHYILGFPQPLTKNTRCLETDTPRYAPLPINGYPDLYSTCPVEEIYPDLSIGLRVPVNVYEIDPETRFCGSSQAAQTYCVARTTQQIYKPPCFSGDQSGIGRAETICSQCLPFYRWSSADYEGPIGYEHCASYDSNVASNPFCAFCPGLGFGAFADACFTRECIETFFIVATVYVALWVLDTVFVLPLHLYHYTNQHVDYTGETRVKGT